MGLAPEALIQLGVSATIAIYLVVWITRGLNGKLIRLAAGMERTANAVERLVFLLDQREPPPEHRA